MKDNHNEYSEEDKHNAQQLRIMFAIYKQGWEDARAAMLYAQHREFQPINKTLEWLNKIPPPDR